MQWSRPFEVMLILNLHQDFINRHNKRGEFYRLSAFIVLLSIYISNLMIWALSFLSSTFIIFPSFVSWLLYISYGCYCVLSIHVLLCIQEHLYHCLWRILRSEATRSLDFSSGLKIVNCTLSSASSTSRVSRVKRFTYDLRVSFSPCLMVSK